MSLVLTENSDNLNNEVTQFAFLILITIAINFDAFE